MKRRDFLRATTALAGAAELYPIKVLASRYLTSEGKFGVHPFITSNPAAVFIMKTGVDIKTNAEAKIKAGMDFSRSIFVPMSSEDGGVPLTHTVVIKPNLTWAQMTNSKATVEGCRGIVTDPEVVEGIVEALKELGISAGQIYTRDKWNYNGTTNQQEFIGYKQLSERTGIDIGGSEQGATANTLGEGQVNWVDITDGVFFTKAPYLWPINSPDSFLINIAKLKTHGMGVTTCAKNLQGSMATPYVSHCKHHGVDMGLSSDHVVPGAFDTISECYNRHLADGIPRWDKPSSGLNMETWCHRCIDNNSVTKPALHVVEGVYGRNGNFVNGPGSDGLAQDFMTNVIIFGKNPFHVDNIAHWIAGHEPGNFGIFHIAIERGLSRLLNPMDIPIYEWKADGSATLTPLTNFERTPLLSPYLCRNYNGQSESTYHMVNEPFDYPAPTRINYQEVPKSFVLKQNYPNPFNPNTSIEYVLPKAGYASIEIYNINGQLVDVLLDGYQSAGIHMVIWNTNNHATGIYFYRFRSSDFSQTRKMTLLK
ncbi:MAG: DUF362 domain-containing protein [Candidatus Latescibacteria bacterium]|nr:DUF362 domain-containing protein [Candidatus Latescibacterota bacterium]